MSKHTLHILFLTFLFHIHLSRHHQHHLYCSLLDYLRTKKIRLGPIESAKTTNQTEMGSAKIYPLCYMDIWCMEADEQDSLLHSCITLYGPNRWERLVDAGTSICTATYQLGQLGLNLASARCSSSEHKSQLVLYRQLINALMQFMRSFRQLLILSKISVRTKKHFSEMISPISFTPHIVIIQMCPRDPDGEHNIRWKFESGDC